MGEGTFTRQLSAITAALASGEATVRVDGPYGRLSVPVAPLDAAQDLQRDSDSGLRAIFCVAGGVGVTPMFSVVMDLYRRVKAAAAAGGGGAESLKDSAFGSLRTVQLIWTCGNRSAFDEWFKQELAEMRAAPVIAGVQFVVHTYATDSKPRAGAAADEVKSAGSAEPLQLDVRVNNPGAGGAAADAGVKSGRPNFGALFRDACTAAGVSAPQAQVAVLACGPNSMIRAVHAEAAAGQYQLHTETFFL
jgi:hypothetical protein